MAKVLLVLSVLAAIVLTGCIITFPVTDNTSNVPQIIPKQENPDKTAEYLYQPDIEKGKSSGKPVIIAFQARPDHVLAGSYTELVWETTNADAVSIEWGDNKREFTASTGSEVMRPVIKTSFILIARNSNGVSVAQAEVTIDRDVIMGDGGGGGACG